MSNPAFEHLLTQTRLNIEFLIEHNQISPSNGREILERLDPSAPNVTTARAATPTTRSASPPLRTAAAPPFPSVPSVQTDSAGTTQARALWDYNERGTEPDDLSFHAGDILEIVAETNPDWWLGRINGKEALFPANYVEKLPPPRPPIGPPRVKPAFNPPTQYPQPPHLQYPNQPMTQYPNQHQPQYPYHQQNGMQSNNSDIQNAAPPPNDKKPKKGLFGGKMGGTLAQSAAGGVGFGAGAAVGSGIINAIF